MAITKEETILAIRISQTIQDYFDQNKNIGTLKSTEVFEVLAKKNISDANIRFREFFKKLATNNALDLVPQCRAESNGKTVNYMFESTPGKTIKARKLVPLVKSNN